MKKIILLLISLIIVSGSAFADDFYILCRPSSEINIRFSAKWTADIIGHKYCGEVVHADGL